MGLQHERRSGKDRRQSLFSSLDRRQSFCRWQEGLRSESPITMEQVSNHPSSEIVVTYRGGERTPSP